LDWFMLVRAVILLVVGVPIIFVGVKILSRLRKVEVASSRIFLHEDEFKTATSYVVAGSLLALGAAVMLLFWLITSVDMLRILAGFHLMAVALLFYYALYRIYKILEV